MSVLGHLRRPKARRGFAAMPAEQAKAIRSQGGKASPMKFNKSDGRAATAGRKGGKISKRSK